MSGGFAQRVVVPAGQVPPLPAGLDLRRAVLAEPLSVVLHAVRRAGDVTGKRVLVTGGTGFLGNFVVTRELNLVGAFRFDREFDEALALLAGGLPVDPVISHTFALDEVTAGPPRRSCSTWGSP